MSKSVPYTRHNEIPRFQTRAGHVKALHYNHVQTGLTRLHIKLRYHLPKLRQLDLILQKDAWIVVDNSLNDIPIISWTDFETEHRENLHEDIICEIRLFHYAAEIILERTLNAMELLLGEELADDIPENLSDILPFK